VISFSLESLGIYGTSMFRHNYTCPSLVSLNESTLEEMSGYGEDVFNASYFDTLLFHQCGQTT
jgi:hypothetical protein